MNIFVTGVTGFVGQHLVKALTKAGFQVFGLSRKKQAYQGSDYQEIKGHLDEPAYWIDRLPERIDYFIHLASHLFGHDKKEFLKVNFEHARKTTEALINKYPQIKMINISSLAAHGPSLKLANEYDEDLAISPYGKSKKKFETYLQTLSIQHISIRPPVIYGPKDKALKDLFKLAQLPVIPIPEKKLLVRKFSFIYISDLIHAIMTIIEKDGKWNLPFYYVSSGDAIIYKDFLKTIRTLKNQSSFYFPIPLTKWGLHSLALGSNVYEKVTGKKGLTLDSNKIIELTHGDWACQSNLFEHDFGPLKHTPLQMGLEKTFQDYAN